MIGIDILGLALAIFPVVVEVVDSYRSRITSREIFFLSESLKNREKIFLNAVEELLSPIVSSTELGKLLAKPRGDLWKDQHLDRKLENFLGSREAELFDTARKIVETVEKLKEKLPPLATSNSSKSIVDKGKKVIKIFVYGPSHKASLNRLSTLVDDFCKLAEQGRRLGPIRRASRKPFGKLRLLQDRARELYQILRGGWDCECDHPHPARLRLDVWQAPPEEDVAENTRFRFLFSVATDDALPDRKWRYAEIVPLSTTGHRQDSILSSTDSASDTAIISPTSTNSSTSPPWAHPAPPNNSPVTSTQVRFDVPGSQGEADEGHHIKDLCEFLKSVETTSEPDDACLGHLIGPAPRRQKFGLYKATDHTNTGSPVVTVLRDLFPRTHKSPRPTQLQDISSFAKLTTADRVQLALTLGWNVLQLHSTPWLEQYWTKDDIFLVSRQLDAFRPYATYEFHSSRRNSISSGTSSQRERLTKWVRDDALFKLGVLLIELCRGQSLADLAEEDDKGLDVMTAMRLSNQLECQFGFRYEDAVFACIHCKFGGASTDPQIAREEFQMGMYENIIKPLEEAAAVHIRPRQAITS